MLRTGLRRLAIGAAGASTAGAAAAYGVAQYGDDESRQSLAIGTVGLLCRAFLRGMNNMTVHDSHHLDHALARPKGAALLSVSNHIATIDDPHLLTSIVPYGTLLRGASEMRWGVCASDVCFRPGSLLERLADCAKVLPIQRDGGVWQSELDAIIGKLRAGGWVHYFPEGKIRQDGRVHPFRRGVGRLAASVDDDSDSLIVLPFYHTGTDRIQPTTPTAKTVFVRPTLGSEVHVIFGAPIDLSEVLALRTQPPFDRRPELLYEVIAHTLEEEVRELRNELHRRLDWPPFALPEGGSFDEDRPKRWQPGEGSLAAGVSSTTPPVAQSATA
mmetsp:Transcript_17940/g.45885  ORF Transcript_17940/g.45885 Transcript_17940/m.45885 type:complete len:329 (-) Transcript_17940:299-1285(-)